MAHEWESGIYVLTDRSEDHLSRLYTVQSDDSASVLDQQGTAQIGDA